MNSSPRPAQHVACKHTDPSVLLSGVSARAILARIVPADPLKLRARVAARLRGRRLLCDGDHVHLRTLAHCARYAPRHAGAHSLPTWIDEQVDAAIDEIVEELAAGQEARDSSAYIDFGRPLGLDARRVRDLCALLNGLPELERRAFIALVLEVDEADGAQAQAQARRALEALLSWTERGER